MATVTHTFNQENWSGETATIKVRKNKFSFNGYEFELRNFDTSRGGNPKYDFHTVDFYCEGKPFGTAIRFEGDEEWEYSDCSITRSHKDPAVLCAIVAANRI